MRTSEALKYSHHCDSPGTELRMQQKLFEHWGLLILPHAVFEAA
jgi:hypothetical protein